MIGVSARQLALLVLPLLAGCGGLRRVATPPVIEAHPEDVELTLFLIGDAGAPAREEPVLIALTAAIEATPGSTAVVFLGDNVYPSGMPPEDAPRRDEAERRLQAQLDVALDTETPTFFVPGNHDWAYMSPDGWASMRRQAAYIAEHGAPYARLLPAGGCPGPAHVDLSPHVRLILLDTQWWLHPYDKPLDPESTCSADSPVEVINRLNRLLIEGADRHAVIAGHHPLESGGLHGGHLGWEPHLFPLRALADWLYIPLPAIGSYYALSRQQGASAQDLASPPYERMRRALDVVFERRRPLIYAAGHDHDLQVLEGDAVQWLVVSGAGIYGHVSDVDWIDDTRYAIAASGFMRLDFLRNGRVRLGVHVVDAEGGATERFSLYLE